MYGLVTIAEPQTEPVSVDRARAHVGVGHTGDDAWLEGAIKAARKATEDYTGRRWVQQTVRVTFDDWPDSLAEDDPDYDADGRIRCPVQPVQSVAVAYLDDDRNEQAIDAEDLDTWLDHHPPLIAPNTDTGEWPAVGDYMGAVRITIVAGYGGANGVVPAQVAQAMLLCIGHWYEERGDQNKLIAGGMPPAAISLLNPLRTGFYR
jgi:uncharacterized phiE125 gp8 family phage protein